MSSCICNHILCTAIDKTSWIAELVTVNSIQHSSVSNFETLSYFSSHHPVVWSQPGGWPLVLILVSFNKQKYTDIFQESNAGKMVLIYIYYFIITKQES